MSEYRQYENGVADVLAFLLGDAATVERNVYLTGQLSESRRQVDVLAHGTLLGRDNTKLLVDCKRWGTKVDVADVGCFIDLVRDAGANLGLLVSTLGASRGALTRARAEHDIHLEIMSLGELTSWRPGGTVSYTYRIPLDRQEEAERVLRNGGFRVVVAAEWSTASDEVALDIFRHYGTARPTGEVQAGHTSRAEAALRGLGIEPVSVASGVVVGGGTPAHRWLNVVVSGTATDYKVLADTPDEADRQLDLIAPMFMKAGIPRSALSVLQPEGWPVAGIFSFGARQRAT